MCADIHNDDGSNIQRPSAATQRGLSSQSAHLLPMTLIVDELGTAVAELNRSSWMLVTDDRLRVIQALGEPLTRKGIEPDSWGGRPVAEVLSDEAWARLEPHFQAALGGEPQSFGYRSDDDQCAYWVQISPGDAGSEGAAGRLVMVALDITERLRTEAELRRTDARLTDSEHMAGVGSWELSLDDETVTYSHGFARLLGLPPGGSITHEDYRAMIHPDDREVVDRAKEACIRDGSGSCEHRAVLRDGRIVTVAIRAELVSGEDGEPRYLRGAVLDVSDQRESERERTAALALFAQGFDAAPIGMALTDPGTGRYLRVNDALCAMLGRSREELLKLSAGEVTHPEDRGRDDHARDALLAGTRSVYHVEKRYLRGDGRPVWAAIHVAPVRRPDGTVEALFAQKIDISERKEREARLYEYGSDARWLGRIRTALDQGRMVLYSQPIVDLATGETVQRELLLRMRDDDGTVIAPGVFLPVAERYGLICEIDRWVIRQAVRLAADGIANEFNLSAASIGNPDVLRDLTEAVHASGIDPRLLIVEVTETAMLDQPDGGRAFAAAVRELGCELALDDFGTGFASLSHLKHLDAQHLKIDIEFVRELTTDETNLRLVRGIVGLAREFEQTTVAEGVEDEETLATLRRLGVDRAQGYLFARPGPLEGLGAEDPSPEPAPASFPGAIETVKAAFEAFGRRDLDGIRRFCHPEVVLRPFATAQRLDRRDAYRGYAGLEQYLEDLRTAWDELRVVPTAWWETAGSVVAAGQAVSSHGAVTETTDTLWICRLRDGLVASVDVFRRPTPTRGASNAVHGAGPASA